MAYRQPRPPHPREGDTRGYIAELNRFLREFCTAAWDADRRRDAQQAQLAAQIGQAQARIAALEQALDQALNQALAQAQTTDGGEG